jgi:type II secretory pathway pseudopilin PulG
MLGNRRGMTLLELLVALITFLGFLAATFGALRSQLRGFTRGTDESGVLQNLRYGVDQMEQDIRSAGANTPDRQPAVVYPSSNAFAFSGDLVSNLPDDFVAVYVDPDAPAGQVSAWRLASAAAIPGSAPAVNWPAADFPTSGAETVTFWFTGDTETSRADDFVLMRQVNMAAPEILMRNVLTPTGGAPFLAYHELVTPATGTQTLQPVVAGLLPLRHSAPQHGQLPDTGAIARIDRLRAVEVRYRVTNARPGTAERIRPIRAVVAMPNIGVKKIQSCGGAPVFGQMVSATLVVDAVTGARRVDVAWNASVDETAGEEDVIRYVLWRRTAVNPDWGDPFTSIPSGAGPYLFSDPDIESGQSYQYSLAAQDCTPTLSSRSTSVMVAVP